MKKRFLSICCLVLLVFCILVPSFSASAAAFSESQIPDYVREEVQRVIQKVEAVRTDTSIVFITMSDFHHAGSQPLSIQEQINTSNLHAAMAAKLLCNELELDFASMLGDLAWGSSTTTEEQQKSQLSQIHSYLDDSFGTLPQFWTTGNHDSGSYAGLQLDSGYLFSQIGAQNSGAVYGSKTEGYCYQDFAAKSIRVICLNTAEGGEAEAISNTQLLWFAKTLADTPKGYGIIILSHHPLDWGSVYQASNVVYQYTERGSVTFDGTQVSFANAKAKVLCNIHGHTHCFKTGKLNYISNGVGTEYDVYRITTPNACFSRNNEYGSNGKTEYYGIEFGDTTTYHKTSGTAQDTAFVVNVVDPQAQTIYSICYGAGVDRLIYTGTQLKILVQPKTVSVSEGENLTMSITAVAAGTIRYSWEYSTDGRKWESISKLGATATADKFTIKATAARNGYLFRCTVTDENGDKLISECATVQVTAKPTEALPSTEPTRTTWPTLPSTTPRPTTAPTTPANTQPLSPVQTEQTSPTITETTFPENVASSTGADTEAPDSTVPQLPISTEEEPGVSESERVTDPATATLTSTDSSGQTTPSDVENGDVMQKHLIWTVNFGIISIGTFIMILWIRKHKTI